MAGALVHLGIALLAAVIIHFIHFKLEYSLSIFVGNLLPDVIKFGFSALKQGTIAIFNVKPDTFYTLLNGITSSVANWFTLGFFVLGVTLLLYHYHFIKKKKMEEYDELYVFVLLGIIIHLIIDALIIEHTAWF